MGDSGGGVSLQRDSLSVADCERRSSRGSDGGSGGFAVSPVLERRGKGVLGRLRNFASRASYSASDDGHSHSSDYEEMDEETKKMDPHFCRESHDRTSSSSWAGRVRDLHRDVKKKLSRLRNSRGHEEGGDMVEHADASLQPGSSVESLPSGSGSSLQAPTPTSSNRSSSSVGEDDHVPYVGNFIGKAVALVDCTPSPYDKDGLAFKKGDIIDIIAKHKTGIWIGAIQGRIGHFKFISVEEITENTKKPKCRHRKVSNDLIGLSKKPDSLEDLLKMLGLEVYLHVLLLNGYEELDTFKEIDKIDLDTLGIIDPEHNSKLLRAAEILNDANFNEENDDDSFQLNQSPRDSGCYASHENLVHNRDNPSHPLEDPDTSQSESCGAQPDSGLAINNLDSNLEGHIIRTSDPLDGYNIPKQRSHSVSNGASTTPESVAKSIASDCGPLSVPYHMGTKSSPASPRKVRGRHARNKSHSAHRGRDFTLHESLWSPNSVVRRSPDVCPGRIGFAYSWMCFAEQEAPMPMRRVEGVASEPPTEAEDSPTGVRCASYSKRVKHRKGSLQTLIHDSRPQSPTLLSKINKKLVAEKIYLHEEPYTDKTGFCGIPPALVQRYSEELEHNIVDVAEALDQIRITSLQQQLRRGVPNDFLSDSCLVPVIEPSYLGLRSWLISLGLPMYESKFRAAGIGELQQVATLGMDDLILMGIHNAFHQVYLESAITVLYLKLRGRPDAYSNGLP